MAAKLPLADVARESNEMLVTARAILAAAQNPQINLTLRGLADATGLTEDALRHVLNSDSYRSLIRQQIETQVFTMTSRGLDAMDRIVHDPGAKNVDRVAAFRAIIQTLDSGAGNQEKGGASRAMAEFQEALRAIDTLNAKKTKAKIRTVP